MGKNINYELFKELYDVTIKIKEMEPWKYFYDIDLITLIIPNRDETIYCSIMGRGKEHYDIGVYPGVNQLLGLLKISEGKIPEHQYNRYNNSLQCTFGNRDDVSDEQYDIINHLGYKFAGENNWIYFKSSVKGYMPSIIINQEAKFLLDVYKHLYETIKDYIENNMEVDFENGESLFRKYDYANNLWYTYAAPLSKPEVCDKEYIIKDELQIARLKNKKRNSSNIEIDTVYLNTPVRDEKYDDLLLPRMTICADINSGVIVNQNLSNVVESKEDKDIIDMFIGYINYYGRPRCVYVRDEFIENLLSDICEKLRIEIIVSDKMYVIDDFVENYMNSI